jgi:hypothetical protein
MKSKKTYVLTVSRQFMKSHPRAGEKTEFVCKILHTVNHPGGSDLYLRCGNECGVSCGRRLKEPKIHTIRANYEYWKKRIDEVTTGEAILSVRYWSGKPYNSKQIEICQLDKYSGVGCVEIKFIFQDIMYPWLYSEKIAAGLICDFPTETIAKNDGLSLEDFKAWFKGYDLSQSMAIIHFTKFRY